ncbi:hypothetical protein VTJ04DRAFT_5420 [Mycothermus thermophilus]|uniref:uncharacterized protein n=1 Tax=Humicola insolens TaxID=85995 RepID=UPI003742E053
MSSQRPFFLSTFFAAFRQTPASLSTASASASQPNKPSTQSSSAAQQAAAASNPRSISTTAAATAASSQAASPASRSGSLMSHLPLHHHHHHQQQHHSHHTAGIPIPGNGRDNHHGRRRGSDSSSEGFREALGADKLYIGGRTATGEERFFKLGVVRRIRSGDRLSLDRLSL